MTLADGRAVSYSQLVELRGECYADVANADEFCRISDWAQLQLDRLGDEIERADPDVVIIVGDDQEELYSPGNIPSIALYWGQDVVTHKYGPEMPSWWDPVAQGYGMDEPHTYPGHPGFALSLIEGLIARDVDLAICNQISDPNNAGFGHAFGFPVERLFRGKSIPIIPVILNTYYPPNVLSSARCHAIGVSLKEAIEQSPQDLRVAVIASGGLSHFVVEEQLDRQVMDNLGQPGATELRAIPREALLEGSSEILNWILAAGVLTGLPLAWSEYEPVRRTAAGTGIGLGFATWRN